MANKAIKDWPRRDFMMATLMTPVVLGVGCARISSGKLAEEKAGMTISPTKTGGCAPSTNETIRMHRLQFTSQEASLFEAIEQIPVIDAHEHLFAEPHRIDYKPMDVFMFFSHYTHGDLARAGMPEKQYRRLSDGAVPLDERWRLLKPYYEKIRMTHYSRSARLACRKFYGYDDFTDETYQPISEAIAAANKPGLYHKVLREACNIRLCLTQSSVTELKGDELLTPVAQVIVQMESWDAVNHDPYHPDTKVDTLQGFLDCMLEAMRKAKEETGAVGFKIFAAPHDPPDRAAAEKMFEDLRSGKIKYTPSPNPIRCYVQDEMYAYAAELGMPVAVHTGYWGDFRNLDPLHMITPITRHPNVRFDMYHLGYPWVRESLMLAKGFDNVWLNMAWTYIISQKMASDGLDEALDVLPSNKILGFGGDYMYPVEKVWGHLVMARECMTRVLARRIERGEMTESQAIDIARQWLWDNPKELYNLDVNA